MKLAKILKVFLIFLVLFSLVLVPTSIEAVDLGVGLEVTAGDSGPPPGGGGTPGCLDPTATNYNPNANVDDGSCIYPPDPVPNVSNFQAVFNNANYTVSLSWINPNFSDFQAVRIVRQINSVPASPTDGVIVYDGSGQAALDDNLADPGSYFYVAFVRAVDERYSSGAIAAAVVTVVTGPGPTPIPGCLDPTATNYNPNANVDDGSCIYDPTPIPGCLDPTATNYNPNATVDNGSCVYDPSIIVGCLDPTATNYNPNAQADDGSCLYPDPVTPGPVDPSPPGPPGPGQPPSTDPFASLPEALLVHPQIASLTLADFRFLQTGRPLQFFERGSRIYIDGTRNFTVFLPYDRIPQVLKTIGLTLYDPDGLSFSFLLRANEDLTAYEATIGPLPKEGQYRAIIYIINFDDQTLKKIEGSLEVSGFTVPDSPLDTLAGLFSGLAIGGGLTAGAIQVAILTTGLASLVDLYLVILRLFGQLAGLLGIRRRHKPWGTVYDSVTKRPIDPAYVSVFRVEDDKEISNAITDIDGRYGFFLPVGQYYLTAGKTNYAFPSKQLAGRTSDELYGNLYFGEKIQSQGEEVVNRNIPLDPVGFDWNEFAKSKSEFFKVYSKKEITRARVLNTVFLLGFIFAVFSVMVTPGWFNIGVLSFYVVLYLFQVFYRLRHKVVSIKSPTGEPIPFALVRFYLTDVDQEVKHVVADHLGRFFVLLRPGSYYFTVEEKQADGQYKRVYHSAPLDMKKGVLTKDIKISANIDVL